MKFFILNGPTCSGKSTIMNALLYKNDDYLEPIVSFTTRPPRNGERHGKDYYYLSASDYLDLRTEGSIVEEVKYLDWNYGVTVSELKRVDNTRKNGIAIMNLAGIRKMKRNVGYQKAISIFLYRDLSAIVASIKEMDISESEANRRTEMAKREMREITTCDYVTYNTGSVAETVQQLKDIIRKELDIKHLEKDIKKGQVYRHFTGETCEIVTDLAEHTETVSPMVVYRSLKTGLLYARPYEIFCSRKEFPPGRGTMVDRFELMDNSAQKDQQ